MKFHLRDTNFRLLPSPTFPFIVPPGLGTAFGKLNQLNSHSAADFAFSLLGSGSASTVSPFPFPTQRADGLFLPALYWVSPPRSAHSALCCQAPCQPFLCVCDLSSYIKAVWAGTGGGSSFSLSSAQSVHQVTLKPRELSFPKGGFLICKVVPPHCTGIYFFH